MKKIIVSVLFLVSSINLLASNYACIDYSTENVAELSINSSDQVFWSEPWHSASSEGVFVGIENAEFSSINGYRIYALTNFPSTEDSGFELALKRTGRSTYSAVTYFDNDDHQEEVTNYSCIIK